MNKEDLEMATGVSARNVRFLISEGILPPPEGNGRSARYTEEHLRILRIYSHAKSEGVASLDVIRRRVAAETEGPGRLDERPGGRVEVMDGLALQIDEERLAGADIDTMLAAIRTALELKLKPKRD